MTSAEGVGPGYCQTCRWKRASDERCPDCPEPLLLAPNLPIVHLFSACSTQWRQSGMGQPLGLDYLGVEAVARIYEIALDGETFARFQHLEREYLKALKDAHERDHSNRAQG